ncbi:hypothetical protein QCA50_014246 [Cerrena zonata]|uniref:DUF6533 domain-containing protein n=1 Tax=Cerrena zonata TaxID=2478898 RepID=A0AAW0FNJ7_9APHY
MVITVPATVPIESFQRLRIETYTDVAAAALLVYDYLLTFNVEKSLIWPSRWNIMKVLFLLTRYLPFVDVTLVLFYQLKTNISVETCRATYFPAGWFIVLGIMVAEIILTIRTWAIWGRSKRIGIILGVSALVAIIPTLYIEKVFLDSLVFSPYPSPATPGCLLTAGNPIIAASFVIVILFETLVLTLTLIKGVQHYRIASGRGFVSVLYRDGVVFYIYLFGISVVNLIVIVAAPRDLANLLAIFQRVMHSLLSARVLMNLREANQREYALAGMQSSPLQHLSFSQSRSSEEDRLSFRRNLDGTVIDIS